MIGRSGARWFGSSGYGCRLLRDGCWRCCWRGLSGLLRRLRTLRRLCGNGHADDRAENQQSVESAGGGILGDGAAGEKVLCGDRTRNGKEEAAFGIVKFNDLVAKQRIGREVDAQGGIGGEMCEREILGAADSFEEELAERNGDADFGDDVFFERAEKIKAAGRIVEDRGGDLRQLALHPENDLLDRENAQFSDCRAEALAGLDQLRGFFKATLREDAFAQHHFAETVLAVAAGGEDELAAVEKKVALDAPENELELAGEASGINFIE